MFAFMSNIKISSITGKIIYENQIEMNSGGDMKNINLIGVSQGIYNMQITTDERNFTKKLVIK